MKMYSVKPLPFRPSFEMHLGASELRCPRTHLKLFKTPLQNTILELILRVCRALLSPRWCYQKRLKLDAARSLQGKGPNGSIALAGPSLGLDVKH